MTTDLDAEEHRLCSDALSQRDAKIRQLIRRYDIAADVALEWERKLTGAEAERDRLAAERDELWTMMRVEFAKRDPYGHPVNHSQAKAVLQETFKDMADLRAELDGVEAQLALDAPIASAARAYQDVYDTDSSSLFDERETLLRLLDLCRAQVKK